VQVNSVDPTQAMVGSQLVNQPGNNITPASNMIDLTINKTPITSDDFHNWRVVQDIKRKREVTN
jgi:hypothetical protein